MEKQSIVIAIHNKGTDHLAYSSSDKKDAFDAQWSQQKCVFLDTTFISFVSIAVTLRLK